MQKLENLSRNPLEQPTPNGFDCPVCHGAEMEIVPGKGARLCECAKQKRRAKLLERIPAKFNQVRLESIKADSSRHQKQATVLELLRKNPERSFFIAGKPGVGKSMLTWALYRHIVESGDRAIICCTLSDLLEEYRAVFRAMQLKEEPISPRLVAEDLMQNRTKYSVFLDDIDKANVTDYVSEQVYRLINAVYENNHQLVVTTNKTVDDLKRQYNRTDDARGGPIIRRMIENATVIEMF
jgi:DNA replication protein DnaC